MAKYSTNKDDNPDPEDEDSSCTMCGSKSKLRLESVAGATVVICKECSENSIKDTDKGRDKESDDKKSKVSNKSDTNKYDKRHLATNRDSSWVEKDRADYGNVKTPYMLPNYEKKINNKIDDKEKIKEISSEINISKDNLLSVVNGNAVQDEVGKSVITEIENYLDIKLQENV